MTGRDSTALPKRQVFQSHQRAKFNAAIQRAAKLDGYLLRVKTDEDGHTIAVIEREEEDLT